MEAKFVASGVLSSYQKTVKRICTHACMSLENLGFCYLGGDKLADSEAQSDI